MARNRSVRWNCLWWCLLCCVLSPVTFAAKKSVSFPSYSTGVTTGKSVTKTGKSLTIGDIGLEGEFIPYPGKNIPIPTMKTGMTIGLDTIGQGIGKMMKKNIGTMIGFATIGALLDGIDWVMEDGILVKHGDGGVVPTGPDDYKWLEEWKYTRHDSAESACKAIAGYRGWEYVGIDVWSNDATKACQGRGPTRVTEVIGIVTREGNGCPVGSAYSAPLGACVAAATSGPVTDADFDAIEGFLDNSDGVFIRDLIHESCGTDEVCYKNLAPDYVIQEGPSTVPGPTTSSTTTTQNSDGTTSQTTTTSSTNFDMKYGDKDFTYTPTTTTTTSVNGKPTSTTTTTEKDAPGTTNPSDTPGTQQKDLTQPSPCGANCTGPEYVDLYEKTEITKEGQLDSYSARVKSLPIISSVGNFFKVTAGAGCPIWSVNTSASIYTATFPINLTFDFHCQQWFTSFSGYASVVFMIVCSFLAFRIAILD